MDVTDSKKPAPASTAPGENVPEKNPLRAPVAGAATTPVAKPLVKEFPKEDKKSALKTVLAVILIISAGVATGYFASQIQAPPDELKSTESVTEEGLKVGDVYGSADEKTFRDSAEGVLIIGGIDGEGSHHLIRTGGETQSVYLTSSTVDLGLFANHKVKVWGETFSAQKAGWLMDVGRVEVVELNAEKPFEE